MPTELLLKPLLKRGALVAAANWQVTLIQATADSLFKLLIATPLVGGLFLAGLVIGTAPEQLMSLEWREMAATIITSLLSHPAVLAAFLASLGVVVVGGSLFTFLVKAGAVAVFVRGEREAGSIEQAPLHLDGLGRASQFSAEYYIEASGTLFPRYARLGFMLMAIYLVSGAIYLGSAYESGVRGDLGGLLTLILTLGFVCWITLINFVYLLMQIVIAADDCSVAKAWRRVGAFVRQERRSVAAVFSVVLVLVVAATGVSLLATAALGLIAFVPFVGLAVLPLQLLAWIFRGVVFQFLGLTQIGAYLRIYREFARMNTYDKYLSPLGRTLHESVLRKMGQVVASRGGDLISFAAGYPDPIGFPWDEFREIATELLSGKDGSVLQYGPTRGYRPLLESVIGVLAGRGITADISQVMTTSGSQQGLDLVARVLIAPGDAVLVEVPTYTGAIAAFRNAQCRLVGVQQDADGINLEELDAVCLRERAAGNRVNLLYLVPNFQNPAGILLGLDKRARLLEWAERRDILIVEDDPYGELYFEDVATVGETRPLKADDRRGRVIYLSTFSKTLAPGFRVAWVAAPEEIIERFDTAKQSMDLMCGILDQRVVHQSIVRGVLERQAEPLRRLYRMRRDVMEEALRDALGDRLTWSAPKGGFFLWAQLPDGYECEPLLTRALEHGVIFVIGSAFCVDGSGHDRIRLSFSWPTPERIREGARRLAAAMQPA